MKTKNLMLYCALIAVSFPLSVRSESTEIETNFGSAVPTPEQLIEALSIDERPKTRGIVLKGESVPSVVLPENSSASTSVPTPNPVQGASAASAKAATVEVEKKQKVPEQPSPTRVAESAAPEPVAARQDAKPLKVATMQIRFAFDSDQISGSAVKQLHILGIALKSKRLTGGTFVLEGHTDAVGDAGYNQRLSERRSMAIKSHLVNHYHISSTQLLTVGMGETSLLNTSEPEASENRRVRIVSLGHVRN